MKEKVHGKCVYINFNFNTTHPAENAAHSPMITVNAYSAVVCSLIDVGGGAVDVIWEVAPWLLILVALLPSCLKLAC